MASSGKALPGARPQGTSGSDGGDRGVWGALQTVRSGSGVTVSLDTAECAVEEKILQLSHFDVLQKQASRKRPRRVESGGYCSDVFQPPFASISKETGFWRGVKFSPDGTCILCNTDDDVLRMYEFPKLERCVLSYDEGECIYDFTWYPLMNSADPSTCCFVSASRGKPVHLWDAYNGGLRASYLLINELDESANALSTSFSPDGTHLLAGVERGLYLWDVTRPGPQIESWRTTTTRKARDGQRGIIGSLAFCPDGSGLFAAGSYNGSVGLYTTNEPCARALFSAQERGVSQLLFSADGVRLFTGGRKSPDVLCWDIRRLNEPTDTFPRQVSTHQRIQFDIDASGQYLLTGSTCGQAKLYSISEGKLLYSTPDLGDVVNGVSFRPSSHDGQTVFAACSGQRHVAPPLATESDSDSDSDSNRELPVNPAQLALFGYSF
mmetsp:Transcript_23969/g.44474  ORF Transcript_23969/g.44474 Transcript_23969/m.44474 type:complete len:437 (+) Transcript_23969:1-1311(+)